jgi:hypothetical protein
MQFLPLLACFTIIGSDSVTTNVSTKQDNLQKVLHSVQTKSQKLDSAKIVKSNFGIHHQHKGPTIQRIYPGPQVDAKILRYMPWVDKRDVLGRRWKKYSPRLIQQITDSTYAVGKKTH